MGSESPPAERRERDQEIERLYTEELLPMDAVAEAVGVSFATVQRTIARLEVDTSDVRRRREWVVRECAGEDCDAVVESRNCEDRTYCSRGCANRWKRNTPRPRQVTDEDLLRDLMRVALLIEKTPTARDMKRHGEYSASMYYKHGKALRDFQRAAGLRTNQRGGRNATRRLDRLLAIHLRRYLGEE
jgi:hypothetical protein